MVCTATGGELPVSGMDDTLSGIPGEAIELTGAELAKQEALADAISLLPTPWHLPDELLFPSSGEYAPLVGRDFDSGPEKKKILQRKARELRTEARKLEFQLATLKTQLSSPAVATADKKVRKAAGVHAELLAIGRNNQLQVAKAQSGLHGVESLEQVFGGAMSYFKNTEPFISEKPGSFGVRDDYECLEGGLTNSRVIATNSTGTTTEASSLVISQLFNEGDN
ncbi:hypothetical protein PHYPSEUDO_007904 [Phytophthora pseudosyringae]|uniref:Uncharacterized protein n=1 Tax=Phytophthora pseudosyringae TaxID=221518 RepID=A0A8T1VIC7_9STRA|nr:hypothetical protein PHYPSEUDO_007904 [Phytophthora pseudosyringae]